MFTGGIGENAAKIRSQVCQGLSRIGIKVDEAKNKSALNKEVGISSDESRIKVLVIPTNEEATIANETFKLTTGKEQI